MQVLGNFSLAKRIKITVQKLARNFQHTFSNEMSKRMSDISVQNITDTVWNWNITKAIIKIFLKRMTADTANWFRA